MWEWYNSLAESNYTLYLIITFLGSLSIASLGIYIWWRRRTKMRQGSTVFINEADYYKYKIKALRYESSFLLKNKLRRIRQVYAYFSIFSERAIVILAVKQIESIITYYIVGLLATYFIYQDLVLTLYIFVILTVYFDFTIDKRLAILEMAYTKELRVAVSQINDTFNANSGNLELAISDTSFKSNLLRRPLRTLAQLIGDTRASTHDLSEYLSKENITLYEEIVQGYFMYNRNGNYIKPNGRSALEDFNILMTKKITKHIEVLTTKERRYRSLDLVSLFPILLVPAMSYLMTNALPGLLSVYNSFYGFFGNLVYLTASILAYINVVERSRASAISSYDRMRFIDALMEKPKLMKWVDKYIPRSDHLREKWQTSINESLSSKTMLYIYTHKVVVTPMVFLLSFVIIFYGFYSTRITLRDDINPMSFTAPLVYYPEVAKSIREFDHEVLQLEQIPDDDELAQGFEAAIPAPEGNEISDHVNRLKIKYMMYHTFNWKWWFVIFPLTASALFYKMPEAQLKKRKKAVEKETKDDEAALLTVGCIVSDSKMDVAEILYWLQLRSVIYKRALVTALVRVSNDPFEALEELSENFSVSPELVRLTSQLKTAVYAQITSRAMASMYVIQDTYLEETQSEILYEIEMDSNSARSVAWMPSIVGIGLMVVGPIIILAGVSMYTAMSAYSAL